MSCDRRWGGRRGEATTCLSPQGGSVDNRPPGPGVPWAPDGCMSFGEELRRERELRQISLREIAQATKIDLRRLEALEQNDFSRLPGGLYNRSFVRAYCEHIGVDAESMVNAYLLEERAQAMASPRPEERLNGLLRGGPGVKTAGKVARDDHASPQDARRRRVRLAVVLMVVTLLVAAGGLALWWLLGRDGGLAAGERATPPAALSHEDRGSLT